MAELTNAVLANLVVFIILEIILEMLEVMNLFL